MIEPKQVTHIGGIPGETAEAKIVKPSPIQKFWKYRWVILALGLHAAIFLLIAAGFFCEFGNTGPSPKGRRFPPRPPSIA